MLRIKRGPNQTGDLVQFRSTAADPIAGVDVNFRYFGDSSRMTGIKKPKIKLGMAITAQDSLDNRDAILADLNAAATDPDITTIVLPNTNLICDELKLNATHSGLTIEGGGKTYIQNKYHSQGSQVILGDPKVIGYYDKMDNYLPGAGATQARITSADPTTLGNYAAGTFIYVFPQYFRQPIDYSRDRQLKKIVSVTSGTGSVTVTFDAALPTNIQARGATATISAGKVTAVTLATFDCGAAYDAAFQPSAKFTGDCAEEAEAICLVNNGALTGIEMTDYGSGYTTEPVVSIGAPPSGGVQATGDAVVNSSGQVVSVTITNAGSGYRAPPSVSFGGPGMNAAATARIVNLLTSVVVTNQGKGYSTAPTVTIDPPPLFAKWVKDARKVIAIGPDFIQITPSADASFFPLNSTVWMCSGSAYNDAAGVYYRVRKATTNDGKIYVFEAIRSEDYIAGQTCLLKGPFIENVTIRNILVGGLEPHYNGSWAFSTHNSVNWNVENVQMLAGGNTLVPGRIGTFRSQYTNYRNVLGFLENQTTNNVSVENSLLNTYSNHSHSSDAHFSFCRLSVYDGTAIGLGSDARRHTFRDCEFNLPGSRVLAHGCRDHALDNCRVVNTWTYWSFIGERLRFSNLQVDVSPNGALQFEPGCVDCVLESVKLPGSPLLGFTSSTGRYSNVTPEPNPPVAWRGVVPFLRVVETTDPTAPVDEVGVLYLRDNGSNKSQLCIRFDSAIVPIAVEP